MGAGIGFIPNAIRTIHIDFYTNFDEAKDYLMEQKRQEKLEEIRLFNTLSARKTYLKLHPIKLKESKIWEEANFMSEQNREDIIQNIASIKICELKNELHPIKLMSEWSAEFNGNGRLVAQNDDVFLVMIQSTDNDLGFGVAPRFDKDDFFNECYEEHLEKEEWHENSKDFCKKKAAKLYSKYIEKVEKMEAEILAEINQIYSFRFRTCAWTMSPEIRINTLKKTA